MFGNNNNNMKKYMCYLTIYEDTYLREYAHGIAQIE